MQSLVKYATAALLFVGSNALIARTANGTYNTPTNYPVDSNFAVNISTYNNGAALSLQLNQIFSNVLNTNLTSNKVLFSQITYLGENTTPVNNTDAVLCTVTYGTAPANTTACNDGYYNVTNATAGTIVWLSEPTAEQSAYVIQTPANATRIP